MTDSPLFWTAVRQAEAVRSGAISAVELVQAHLEHLHKNNRKLTALVLVRPEEALAEARAADEARARGDILGPLHGVPITVKDSLETAGVRTSAAYKPLLDHVPTRDATAVGRLRRAGAILLGKTNLPELAADYTTQNSVFGNTNNPWCTELSPGGSSGGSAAAIAAGFSALELGSDLGGSLRLPAHFCGVYSYKPSEGVIPLTGHIPDKPGEIRAHRFMQAVGPVARSVEDLELAARLAAGPDRRDWSAAPVPLERLPEPPLNRLRIGIWLDFEDTPMLADYRDALLRFALQLAAAGCQVETFHPRTFPLRKSWEVWGELVQLLGDATMDPEKALDIKKEQASRRKRYPERFHEMPHLLGKMNRMRASSAEMFRTLDSRDRLTTALEEAIAPFDALICPAAGGPAYRPIAYGAPFLDIVGHGQIAYARYTGDYLRPFSLTGSPVVTLPLPPHPGGLPLGFQLVGKRWQDSRLLATARSIARVVGPFMAPPGALAGMYRRRREETIPNFLRINLKLTSGGQPTRTQIQWYLPSLAATVVNLAMPDSPGALEDEEALVKAAGMKYFHIPVAWDAPTAADLDRFVHVMQELEAEKKSIFVHCAMNMRATAFLYLYARRIWKIDRGTAYRWIDQVWEPNETWAAFIAAEENRCG